MGKGSRRERECVELYQRAGMATYRPATVQYGENDVFGLFDVLAFSPRHQHLHAVQVKSNNARGIRSWARETALFRSLGMRTFYAVPVDGAGWRVIEAVQDRIETRVDERETDANMGEGVVRWLRGEQT